MAIRRSTSQSGQSRVVWRQATIAVISLGLTQFAPKQIGGDFSLLPAEALAQDHGDGGTGGHDDGNGDGHEDGGDGCVDGTCGDDGSHDDGSHEGGSPGSGGQGGGQGGGHGDQGGGHHEGGPTESAHPRNEYGGRTGRNDLEEQVFRRHGGGEIDMTGRPAWAGGAVPEDIELGRLNMARAPGSVRAHALEEVYLRLDADGDGELDPGADLHAIESPLGNLALYEKAIKEAKIPLNDAAWLLGSAAEKSLPIGTGSVYALHTILGLQDPAVIFEGFTYDRSTAFDAATIATVFGGVNASGSDVAGFAQAADDVRAVKQFEHDQSGDHEDGPGEDIH